MTLPTLGARQAGLAKAFREMNLWRIPRMEVESPTLLVYGLTKEVSAAAKAGAGDITAQISAITPVIKVMWMYCYVC